MNKIKKDMSKTIIGMVAYLARSFSNEPNILGWPPVCMGILYQPKRPLKSKVVEQKKCNIIEK